MSQQYAPSTSSARKAQQQPASPSTPTVATTNGDYFQQKHANASPLRDEVSQQEKLAAMEDHQKRFAEARDR